MGWPLVIATFCGYIANISRCRILHSQGRTKSRYIGSPRQTQILCICLALITCNSIFERCPTIKTFVGSCQLLKLDRWKAFTNPNFTSSLAGIWLRIKCRAYTLKLVDATGWARACHPVVALAKYCNECRIHLQAGKISNVCILRDIKNSFAIGGDHISHQRIN